MEREEGGLMEGGSGGERKDGGWRLERVERRETGTIGERVRREVGIGRGNEAGELKGSRESMRCKGERNLEEGGEIREDRKRERMAEKDEGSGKGRSEERGWKRGWMLGRGLSKE